MSVFSKHQETIDALWDRLDRRLESYPPPMDQQVEGLRQYVDAPARSYFNRPDAPPLILLTIWLGKDLEEELLLDVVESAALLYLHIRIQDDVLDEPETRGRADWLLLGNALLWDGFDFLRRRVQSDEFWRVGRLAWLQFSCATAKERTQLHSSEAGSYHEGLFQEHCRKVAMAEIPLLAVLALQSRFELYRYVSPLILDLGVAYGLTNDVVGFKRDVAAGMRTHLIDQVQSHVPRDQWKCEDSMSRALLERDHIEGFLERARRAHRSAAKHAKNLGISEFSKFTSERVSRLDELERQVQITRLAAAMASESL